MTDPVQLFKATRSERCGGSEKEKIGKPARRTQGWRICGMQSIQSLAS